MSPSLFEAPKTSVLAEAASWLPETLGGSVATFLCVLAVAWLGIGMMGGRLAIRNMTRVVVGCFVLFSAPILAEAFHALAQSSEAVAPDVSTVGISEPNIPRDARPSAYDPYAGASLRNDR